MSNTLPLTVNFTTGRRNYQVTGTRHAGNLLRKLADNRNFIEAVLTETLSNEYGSVDNPIRFNRDDIKGADRFGKFQNLFNRSNSNYDLSR